MKINWKEVFKFLSGAAFVGAFANAYLYFSDISLPFFGWTLSAGFLGLRALGAAMLFLIFFYYGYLKKEQG